MAIKKRKRGFGGSSARGSGGQDSGLRPRTSEKKPPCQNECPCDNQIREVLTTIAQTEARGRTYDQSYEQAWHLFTERSPFPSVCGRVCPHPCETGCNRKDVDEPTGINAIERFIGDYGIKKGLKPALLSEEKHSEKVAIIGAGPAGLSCAYQLARRGYPVTVFEAFDKAGGMLRWGIPAYRLPRDILDAEIARIVEMGVELKCNTSVGNDISYEDLKKAYKAIFCGIGAHKGWTLGIKGEDAPNVYTGTEFLNQLNSGKKIDLGDQVYVIGGGDTAIDAARVSIRLGAKATILYRRTQKEMPAIDEEIEEAMKENIPIDFLAAPIEILTEGGKAVGMKCIRMELGEPDASGRRRPVPKEGSEYEVKCSTIVAAISQGPDTEPFKNLTGERDKVISNNEWGQSKEDGVWVGGDVINLALVTTAIGQGRKAAEDIDCHLRGKEHEPAMGRKIILTKDMELGYYDKKERNNQTLLPVEERFKAFDTEVAPGLTEDQVKLESSRCMSCGYCMDCERCWMYCQATAVVKPAEKGGLYTFKLELCNGCKKCGEQCPCGFIDLL